MHKQFRNSYKSSSETIPNNIRTKKFRTSSETVTNSRLKHVQKQSRQNSEQTTAKVSTMFRSSSEQVPNMFRNRSETAPKQFRTSSQTVPKQLQSKRSDIASNQVRISSQTNPKQFQNSSEQVPNMMTEQRNALKVLRLSTCLSALAFKESLPFQSLTFSICLSYLGTMSSYLDEKNKNSSDKVSRSFLYSSGTLETIRKPQHLTFYVLYNFPKNHLFSLICFFWGLYSPTISR